MQNDSHSRSSGPLTSDDIAARIQSLRNILRTERHVSAEQQIALEALDQEEAHRLDARFMERDIDSLANPLPRSYTDEGYWEAQSRPSTTSIARERRRPTRPSPAMNRHQARLNRLARSEPLEQDHVSAARLSPLHSSRTRQASADLDVDPPSVRERRAKRRKLNDGTPSRAQDLPDYGVAQVHLRNNLKMKLIDSGDIVTQYPRLDDLDKLNIHLPENTSILRTRTNQCNILMKHQGDWSFDLSKISVKLPFQQYDNSPLQGLVFVTMKGEDLLAKTAHYDTLLPAYYVIHHSRRLESYRRTQESSRPQRRLRSIPNPRRFPDPTNAQWCDSESSDTTVDISQNDGFEVTVENTPDDEHDGTSTSPRSPQPWHDTDQEYSRRRYGFGADSYRPDYDDDRTRGYYRPARAEEVRARTDLDGSASPTESEDDEVLPTGDRAARDLEEAQERQRAFINTLQSERERRPRNFTNRNGFSDLTLEEVTQARELGARLYGRSDRTVSSPDAALNLSHSSTSRKRLPGPSEMLQGKSATFSGLSDESDEKILPHAKFQIGRDSSGAITISFDPPIAGKYILLKLWTQCPNSTISVQNIVPYGTAGLRQIPDTKFR